MYSVLLILLLASCSGYEKLLKSTDNNLKYRKAFEYYNNGDYTRAATIFDQIVNIFRGTNKSDSVTYFQAMSYYGEKDYITAGYYLKTFFQTYPYSPFAEEAEFLSAYCFYLTSPNPELDQENTVSAIEAFNSFINKHPLSKRTAQAHELVAELQDKLVEKSFISAKLYFDLGLYKSSIIALHNSLDDYPNTKFREELMWLILRSNYLLASKSIESKQKQRFQDTIDEYYSFISQFPESKYKGDADDIYKVAERHVQ